MKRLFSFIQNNLLELYIVLNIFYILIGSLIFNITEYTIKDFSLGLIDLLVLNIVVGLILSKSRYRFHIVDVFVFFIIMFGIIATIFAYRPSVSLYGAYGRYEGLFSICYYFSVFYLSTYAKNKKLIVYSIIFTGFVQLFYGICQIMHLFGVDQLVFLKNKWVTGLTTNPNFFGAYMLICLALSIGLFIDCKDKFFSIVCIFISIFFMYGLFLSNTLSSLVGLFGSLFISFIYCLRNKKLKKFIVIVLFFAIVFSFMDKTDSTKLLKDVIKTKEETIDISKGKAEDQYGTGRVFIWKSTIKKIPQYFWHGIGIDNFGYINNGRPFAKRFTKVTFTYDKVHNDYLQILVTSGIFSLLSFLCLHFITLLNGFRISFKEKQLYLILPVVGYLINNMFSFSVIEVTPIFYILLGLLISRDKEKIRKNMHI